jgi:hypothetical protein
MELKGRISLRPAARRHSRSGKIREAPQGLGKPRPTCRTLLVGHVRTVTSFC